MVSILKIYMYISTNKSNASWKKKLLLNADWQYYSEKKLLPTLPTHLEENESAYDVFIKTINNNGDLYIPFIQYSQFPENKFKPKLTWNPELSR